MLLLSVGRARAAARLVQIRALSLARGEGSARGARRLRRRAAREHRDPRVGFDGRNPVSRAADATVRDGGLERGAPHATGHPRCDDRHGAPQAPRRGRVMDGIHDMGGMDVFGKVEPEPNEPPFHASWEGRVLAMQRAMGYAGAWHIDMSRFAQERLPPQVYVTASYYQRWALAMEKNVVERGYADAEELAAGHALRPGKPLKRKLTTDVVRQGMTRGSFYRQAQAPARFKPGDRVRTKNIHPPTHTRLPRYARGRLGVVQLVHGCHAFPDAVAIDKGDDPQWLYTVVFDGAELWGPDADPTVKVSIDAFEPYLDPA